MLTTPNPKEKNRPLFAAKDIKDFYLQHCPKIFPQDSCSRFVPAANMVKSLMGPKYDGNIFTVRIDPSTDALLSNICTGTSAAPTYFPAHYFQTQDSSGKTKELHLIDGGVAANNPTLVAINEVSKEIIRGNLDFFPIKSIDYARFLVVSLGTGSPKCEEKYNASLAAKWGG
ncbi:hypothetical protein V6N13_138979 [Hibiscus sabdariffa]|uniref:Patatin n=1 Tax=Hibiscus sabdariffa TaxID=183260 RepID=A0ABR2PKE3_9ROSI